MPRTVMLTLGRLPKALDLARGLAAAGHRVVVAEPHRWHLTRLSRAVARCIRVPPPLADPEGYRSALVEATVREGVDVVVPVSEEILHVAAIQPRLPSRVRLACADLATLLGLHHKGRFVERAAAHGLAVPRTAPLGSPAAAAIAESAAVVVKPTLSCAGKGVRILERGASLPDVVPGVEQVVQAFVEGPLLSSFSIAWHGTLLVSVVYRATVLSGTVAVCFERVDGARAVEDWIGDFVRAEGFGGMIGFDFVLDRDGRAVAIECNPRATSGVHFLREEDLAAALLEPEEGAPVRLRDVRLLQQFWPCLTETQAAMLRGRGFGARARQLLRARDVSWSARDPLPLLLQPLASYPILLRTVFAGQSFGEAATGDIEWHSAAPAAS